MTVPAHCVSCPIPLSFRQYDVVAYRHVKGQENTLIYQFLLRRRPGQGPLISEVGCGSALAQQTLLRGFGC